MFQPLASVISAIDASERPALGEGVGHVECRLDRLGHVHGDIPTAFDTASVARSAKTLLGAVPTVAALKKAITRSGVAILRIMGILLWIGVRSCCRVSLHASWGAAFRIGELLFGEATARGFSCRSHGFR